MRYVDIIRVMVKEGLYFNEPFSEEYIRSFKIDRLLYQGRSKFQLIQCFTNKFFGKMLFLDKKIQSAQIDEFIYHESLVHPMMLNHPDPRNILILGGGEGATMREVLRYPEVEKVTMVDIDKELIEICKQYLPEWSEGAFDHPKTELIIGDARRFVEETQGKYDVIISDLTEPVSQGPSVMLFTEEFYLLIRSKLKENGLFVMQAGSADVIHHEFFLSCYQTLKKVFPGVKPFWVFVLSFGLPWGFLAAAKVESSLAADEEKIKSRYENLNREGVRFYWPEMHRSYFVLPAYLLKNINQGKVITDKNPYIWTL